MTGGVRYRSETDCRSASIDRFGIGDGTTDLAGCFPAFGIISHKDAPVFQYSIKCKRTVGVVKEKIEEDSNSYNLQPLEDEHFDILLQL